MVIIVDFFELFGDIVYECWVEFLFVIGVWGGY